MRTLRQKLLEIIRRHPPKTLLSPQAPGIVGNSFSDPDLRGDCISFVLRIDFDSRSSWVELYAEIHVKVDRESIEWFTEGDVGFLDHDKVSAFMDDVKHDLVSLVKNMGPFIEVR